MNPQIKQQRIGEVYDAVLFDYPEIFNATDPKPLKLGIRHDL